MVTRRLNVLVACEYSGTVRDAFIAAGHRAMSCLVTYWTQMRQALTTKVMCAM